MLQLQAWSTLQGLVDQFDRYLDRTYPDFFGSTPKHPFTTIKPYKVIHDSLWGTNRFSWRELAIMDSPLLQRLRGIQQTGLAHYLYPCARHSRFEHSLGVTTVASRAFDAVAQRHLRDIETIANNLKIEKPADLISQLREELRLAALLHDVGHSIYSHASEQVYQHLPLMEQAAKELHTFVGKRKGAGEVMSFCFARTQAVQRLLAKAYDRLSERDKRNVQPIDFDNVSLLIVGRSKHPFFQFMADIISSDLDADKLDYLLRDAAAAGLPLRYDLERYLYLVGNSQGGYTGRGGTSRTTLQEHWQPCSKAKSQCGNAIPVF